MVALAAVGQRTKRVDAPEKLTGQERFTADLRLPGLLVARPVGRAYAHARILGVDKTAALAIPGVVAVLTAADLPLRQDKNGAPAKTPIARDEALYAGHIIALVLAETDAAAGTPPDLPAASGRAGRPPAFAPTTASVTPLRRLLWRSRR